MLTDSPVWASPIAVRAALAQAWGNGAAVLLTRAWRGPSDRLAERIWRSWGGHVQRHPHPDGWDIHHGHPDRRGRGGRRVGSADVSVSLRGGARVVDHDLAPAGSPAALARARRAVAQARAELRDQPTDQGELASGRRCGADTGRVTDTADGLGREDGL